MPPADIVAHLALHGVKARSERAVEDEDGIGAAGTLLNYAFESRADLTVIGAAAQGFPLRRLSAGAREVLRSTSTPVLLSH